jgi:4-amino-4-deoxy-L-arabinose transferase-like glycosyltransferase
MKGRILALKDVARRVLLHRHFYPACFAAALLIRLVFIGFFDAQPLSDFGWYFDKGREIAAGEGYVVKDDGFPLWEKGKPLETPRPTAFWPVGYPAFLAALFTLTSFFVDPLLAAKVANAFLYLGAIGAVAYSTKVVFSPLAGRISALILAFLPNHIAYTTLTSVEIYFVFLTTAAIALVLHYRQKERWSSLVGAGLLFGLAILAKPQSILLGGVILAALYWGHWRRLARATAIVYVAALLCVLPWTYRNYQAFDGRFVLVSNNGGINLLIFNMPGAWGNKGLMWNKELHEIIASTDDEVSRDKAARAAYMQYAKHNVGRMIRDLPMKVFALYSVDVDGFGWNQGSTTRYAGAPVWLPFRAVSQVYWMAMLGLALGSAWYFRKQRTPEQRTGPVVLLYFTGISLVFAGGPRFHFPISPWLAAYAAGLLGAWLEGRARGAERGADSKRQAVLQAG